MSGKCHAGWFSGTSSGGGGICSEYAIFTNTFREAGNGVAVVEVGRSAGSTAGGLTTVVFATKCAFGVIVLIGMVRMSYGREIVCTEGAGCL